MKVKQTDCRPEPAMGMPSLCAVFTELADALQSPAVDLEHREEHLQIVRVLIRYARPVG